MITLNLLPPDLKGQVKRLMTIHHWQPVVIRVALTSIILLGLTIFANMILALHRESLETPGGTQTNSSRKTSDITQQTARLNTTVTSLSTGLGQTRSWSKDLSQLITILPADITVTSLKLSSDGHVQLEGVAKTRLAFLSLQTALNASPLLKNVATTSTASKRDNVPFIYTALMP